MDCCIQDQGLSKRSKGQCLSRKHLNRQTFCYQAWYIVMRHHEPDCHAKRLVCYFQGQGYTEGSYGQDDSFYYHYFLNADPFATKLGLTVHYYKLGCPMKKLDFCVQGQGQNEI